MFTYRDIKMVLDNMSPEQLDQHAQIFMSQADGDKSIPLCSVIGFHTIEHWLGDDPQQTRSSFDNEHYPKSYVFLADWNPFSEDGTIGFNLLTGERIYGKNKKKDVEVEDEFGETFFEQE